MSLKGKTSKRKRKEIVKLQKEEERHFWHNQMASTQITKSAMENMVCFEKRKKDWWSQLFGVFVQPSLILVVIIVKIDFIV